MALITAPQASPVGIPSHRLFERRPCSARRTGQSSPEQRSVPGHPSPLLYEQPGDGRPQMAAPPPGIRSRTVNPPNRCSTVMPSTLPRRPSQGPTSENYMKMLKSGRAGTKQVRKVECYVCWTVWKGMGGNCPHAVSSDGDGQPWASGLSIPSGADAGINITVGSRRT